MGCTGRRNVQRNALASQASHASQAYEMRPCEAYGALQGPISTQPEQPHLLSEVPVRWVGCIAKRVNRNPNKEKNELHI